MTRKSPVIAAIVGAILLWQTISFMQQPRDARAETRDAAVESDMQGSGISSGGQISKESGEYACSAGNSPADWYLNPEGQDSPLVEAGDEVIVKFGPVGNIGASRWDNLLQSAGVLEARAVANDHELLSVRVPAYAACEVLNAENDVLYAYPVLVDETFSTRVMVTDEIVVGVEEGVDVDALAAVNGAEVRRFLPMVEDQWVFGIENPKGAHPIDVANSIREQEGVVFAEPVFIVEGWRAAGTSDPVSGMEWYPHSMTQYLNDETSFNPSEGESILTALVAKLIEPMATKAGEKALYTLSYDDGALNVGLSSGWAYAAANRFTNTTGSTVQVTAVQIYKTSSGGSADVYLWADAGGSPGASLGSLLNQTLSVTGYNSFNVSSFNAFVSPGADVYGGFHQLGTAQIPYDSTPSAGRSWYEATSGGPWTLGNPSPGSQNRDLMVRLTVNTVAAAAMTLSPTSLSPNCFESLNAASQTFTVRNSGGGILSYSISPGETAWMSVTPESGTAIAETDTITVNYATSGLTVGTYNGTITVSDPAASNSPRTISVTLTVLPPQSEISRSPSSLSPACQLGQNAASQSFQVWNSGALTLDYAITSDSEWLSIDPSSGTSTGEADTIAVNYSTSGLSLGNHTGTITITDPAAANSPQTVSVTVKVEPTLAMALDCESLTWLTEGDALWYGQTAASHDAQDAAQSGLITHSQSSTLKTNVTSPGTLTFWWRVSSQATNDALTFYIDTTAQPGAISGTPAWAQKSCIIPSGTHEVKWIYAKDASTSSGSDAAWVDEVVYTPFTTPVIGVTPASLTQSCGVGQNASSQTFGVFNQGIDTLNYSIATNAAWLSVDPASGTSTGETDTITVNYATSELAAGTYNGTITITDAAAPNSPQTVAVALTVIKPAITRSPTTLAPSCAQGQNAASQTFTVRNSSLGTLNYSISTGASTWMSVDPASGTSSGETDTITVNYATSALSAGTRSGTITITDPGASNTPQTIAVTLTISGPAITRSPTTLAPSCYPGQNAASQMFTVRNSSTGTLNYSISTGAATWLSVSPASGTSTTETDTITVTYATSELAVGTHSATITILDPLASNSPQTIAVTLTVLEPLSVSPAESFSSTGRVGGPFRPTSKTYTLTNVGVVAFDWTATVSVPWIQVSSSGGTLEPGTPVDMAVSLTSEANSLPSGLQTATVTLTDTASGGTATRQALLQVYVTAPGSAGAWSTYLGGTAGESGQGIAVDSDGNVYVAGTTYSSGWASGGWDTTWNGNGDGFVVKLGPNGDHLWSTYLGGSGDDLGQRIAVDPDGNVYAMGYTASSGWVSGGWDNTYAGSNDAYIVKLSPEGEHRWSTYLGGTGGETGFGLAVDSEGNVYATGFTASSGWVSLGWDTSQNGGNDAYVVKLSAEGEHVWSTYLGGSANETGGGVAVDSSGNVYATGFTASSGWASLGWDTSYGGGNDAYIVKLNDGGQHVWSMYLGGSGSEMGNAAAVDSGGNLYVVGYTGSSGWVSGGWDTTYSGSSADGFVVKLNSSGTPQWSSYLGGAGEEYGKGVSVDPSGNVYVTGYTPASGWVSGGWDTTYGGAYDGFVVKLTTAGAHAWSTYIGGTNGDHGYDIFVDSSENVYATGYTASAGWVSGGWDTVYAAGNDGFAIKIAQTPVGASNPGADLIGTGAITWTWQDNSIAETGFEVWSDPGAGPPATLRTITAAGALYWEYTDLTANTQYSFQVAATNGFYDSAKTENYARYTLAGPPSIGDNVACDQSLEPLHAAGTMFTFTNPAGFGTGTDGGDTFMVSKFKFAWNTSATYTFTGSETDWSSGALIKSAVVGGSYYLHLESFNAEDVSGGTLDYGPFDIEDPPTIGSGAPWEYEFSIETSGDVTVTDSIPGRDGVQIIPADMPAIVFGGITYNLFAGTNSDDALMGVGTPEDDEQGLNNVDLILGFDGNDALRGLNGGNVLIGGAGNDKLYGDNGSDVLLGGAGNDTLYPGSGDDVSDGGLDNDLVVLAVPGNTSAVFNGGEGVGDKLLLANGYGRFSMAGCHGFEKFAGGDGNDTVDWSDATVALEMRGNGGDDTLTGGSGDDVLRGGIGNDTLAGGDGSDVQYGENGDDDLRGDAGTDTLYTGSGSDAADGGEGDNDKVVLGDANGLQDTPEGGAGSGDELVLQDGYGAFEMSVVNGFEKFTGGDGNDNINWSAATVVVVMRGNGGDDALIGGSGADLLTGGDGNDVLSGREGTDTLYGEGGINDLTGGSGNDSIRGGAGDYVHFAANPVPPRYAVRNAGSYIVVTDTSGEDGMDTIRGCIVANIVGPLL